MLTIRLLLRGFEHQELNRGFSAEVMRLTLKFAGIFMPPHRCFNQCLLRPNSRAQYGVVLFPELSEIQILFLVLKCEFKGKIPFPDVHIPGLVDDGFLVDVYLIVHKS